VNGNFPVTGSQLNIQHTAIGYSIDVAGTNKFLQINPSFASKTMIYNTASVRMDYGDNVSAFNIVNDNQDGFSTNFDVYGDGRTKIGATPTNFPPTANIVNATLVSTSYGTNVNTVYNGVFSTQNDLNKGIAVFKRDASGHSENFSVQGNGQTNIGKAGSNFGTNGNQILSVNGAMRVGGGANYLSIHHDGGSNTIDGMGPNTPAGINNLDIGQYSPMNVSIAANQAGYGNLGVGGNINANNNVNIGSPSATASRLNILAPEGTMGIVSKTNHTGINGYNVQLFNSKNMTKALAIQDEEITNAALRETFLVYGNGSTTINAETSNSNQAMLTINSANATNTYENKFVVYADGRTVIGDVAGYFPVPALGYKLAVKGKIVAEEVLVANRSLWPDYVFNNNYKLKSIDELDTYIKTNKHLPNIPSASEMAAGIETGTMITKQMEKIEELTLYIIEQNKKIQEQEKRLKALEEKLK
jgi:trimeric autotransporter adhesin